MKRKAMLLIICLLLLFLLCYPKEALHASKNGMQLWLDTLLPTLLPFMILTNILIHTEGITKIVHPISPFFKVFFGLSPNGHMRLFWAFCADILWVQNWLRTCIMQGK